MEQNGVVYKMTLVYNCNLLIIYIALQKQTWLRGRGDTRYNQSVRMQLVKPQHIPMEWNDIVYQGGDLHTMPIHSYHTQHMWLHISGTIAHTAIPMHDTRPG